MTVGVFGGDVVLRDVDDEVDVDVIALVEADDVG